MWTPSPSYRYVVDLANIIQFQVCHASVCSLAASWVCAPSISNAAARARRAGNKISRGVNWDDAFNESSSASGSRGPDSVGLLNESSRHIQLKAS